MYNRYIRNEQGAYSRIPQQEPAPRPVSGDRPLPRRRSPRPRRRAATRHRAVLRRAARPSRRSLSPTAGRTVSRPAAVQAPTGDIDSGDLLLLLILFFLFREEADEEVLIAIGLLLILVKRTERHSRSVLFYVVRIISCHGGRYCPAYC